MDARASVRAEMRVGLWRLRLYCAGFLVVFALHLAAGGLAHWPAMAGAAVVAVLAGVWTDRPRSLRAGVMLGVLHALVFPILEQAAANGESIAAVVARAQVWPQLLVTLIGSRVLASEGELSFARLWQRPVHRTAAVELQSVSSAIALGCFLTLVFYLAAPHALAPGGTQPSAAIAAALLGGTVIHTAIVLLFFVILSSILDAARLYAIDRSVLVSFGRLARADRKAGSGRDLASIVANELSAAAHTRAVRLLNAAIATCGAGGASPDRLATLAFDGFQSASRQFVRALLPMLPLLGFLGTVIGLATAIAALPQGLSAAAGHVPDLSASLAGLAVKFETTLLGLMASLVCSLVLAVLEKREAELAAECMLIVGDAADSAA